MAVVLTLCVVVVSAIISGNIGYLDGYRRGQIDALSGNVRFELVEQGNKEVVWREIEK